MSQGSSLRQQWLPVRTALAVCATLVVFGFSAYFPQPTVAQEVMRSRSETGDLECISYCSTTRPGVIVMEVRMRLAESPLSETNLRSKVRQQGLEVTVYSEGFERKLFATVAAIKPRAFFRAPARAGSVTARTRIPGLEKLEITDVTTRFDKPTQSTLLIQPSTGDEAAEWVTIRLEGLDPGMDYTFRVPGGRSVVTCQAVICPVDIIPAPAIPANSKPANRTKRKPGPNR